MKMASVSVVLAGLMAVASVGGIAARPTKPPHDPNFKLETIVPKRFGDWQEVPDTAAQVVNPQTQELLDKLYSQILSRSYVNARGYRIMLSLAFGDDQRGGLAAHKPEVCYPAQGFTLQSLADSIVTTPYGNIAGRRLATSLGSRKEPVTYWFTVGGKQVRTQLEQRMVEMLMGVSGTVPDGVLFRVSSIDDQPSRAWQEQDAFVRDLLKSIDPKYRVRLSGLDAPA